MTKEYTVTTCDFCNSTINRSDSVEFNPFIKVYFEDVDCTFGKYDVCDMDCACKLINRLNLDADIMEKTERITIDKMEHKYKDV